MICTSRYVSDPGCQSSHSYAQKCLIKPTTLLTRTRIQTNIQSSQSSSKYHANTARTTSCLTESPHIHITSHNYILITLNNNKPQRQILQLLDRREVCASECKQVVSHAENWHVATTKLHEYVECSNYLQTICLHKSSVMTSKTPKMSGETQTNVHDHVRPGACTFRRRRCETLISGTFTGFPEPMENLWRELWWSEKQSLQYIYHVSTCNDMFNYSHDNDATNVHIFKFCSRSAI